MHPSTIAELVKHILWLGFADRDSGRRHGMATLEQKGPGLTQACPQSPIDADRRVLDEWLIYVFIYQWLERIARISSGCLGD